MPNERNEDLVSLDVAQISLDILDIIRFMGDLRLAYLGDEISNEIIVNYNGGVDPIHYIDDKMTGADIREQFNKLPNNIKQVMMKKAIISDEVSKSFIMQVLRNSNEQYEFFVRDSEITGGLLNTFSVVVIVFCCLVYVAYSNTAANRGELGKTVSDKVLETVVEYFKKPTS